MNTGFPAEYFSNMNIVYYYGDLSKCTNAWKDFDITCSFSKLYYIIEGECIIEIGGVKYIGKKGTLFLIPAGTKHSFYHFSDNYIKKYWFHFGMEIGGANLFNRINIPYYIDVIKNSEIKKLFKEILQYSKSNELSGILYLKSCIIKVIAFYLSHFEISELHTSSTIDTDLSNVLKYIKDNLQNQITVNMLANIAHLHPNYFIRIFKLKFGNSPVKYINNLKMELTKSMLENTTMSINEIMQKVGFGDLSYFSNSFKKYSGYSPKMFRIKYNNSCEK